MALNRYAPHLYVLPEDDATHDIAIGFTDYASGPMQVLKPVRGWSHVLQEFKETFIPRLRQYKDCHLVLLIDFDNDFPNRLQVFQKEMPADIADRVYVLGALDEAEVLRNESNLNFRNIGLQLASECEQKISNLWAYEQVQHNQAEVQRLHINCWGMLF